jgi:hypothetical protein
MPINNPHFDEYAIERLKFKLSEKIGFIVSNRPDCHKLSEIINQSGYGSISDTTIYRLFFSPKKHSPFKHTMDILAMFLGYKNSIELLEHINSTRNLVDQNAINTTHNHRHDLMFYCIENGAYKPLLEYFNSLDDSPVFFKEKVGLNLYDNILKSTKQIQVFKEFANHKFVREYLLEKAHDPKFRIKNYEFAYLKYLEGIDKNKSVLHFQEYLFGNCVLFRHYYLNNQYTNAELIGDNIYKDILSLEPFENDLYIFPFIRFTAYKLWYLKMKRVAPVEQIEHTEYLLDLCKKRKENLTFYERKILFHTVAEVILQSELPEKFHWDLKKIFLKEFDMFPDKLYSKHLKYSLHYFEPNGLINHRP